MATKKQFAATKKVSSEKPVSERRAINAIKKEARQSKQKWPKTIGACVDLAYELKLKAAAIADTIKPISQMERDLEEHMKKTFKNAEINGAQGKLARAEFNEVTVPNVEDWDKLYAYVEKTKSYDLLHRRLSTTAIRERWDAKKKVPGVVQVKLNQMSILKLPARKQKS